VDNIKRVEYVEKNQLRASLRMLREMDSEAVKIEERLFIKYMDLKNRSETFSKSQSLLRISFLLKFLIFLAVSLG
jgi:hypothetical protein